MKNSFFLLSDNDRVVVERFHICSWNIRNKKAFIEFGLEFKPSPDLQCINFKIAVQELANTKSSVRCLSSQLLDIENSKYIFNDLVVNKHPINKDIMYGATLDFENRGKLTILPTNPKIDSGDGTINLGLKDIPQLEGESIYLRVLLTTDRTHLAELIKNFTNTKYTFDIKVNENRNLPNKIKNLIRDHYFLTKIKSCFSFHVVPTSFNISFVDNTKFQNIRILETNVFKRYLPEIGDIKDGEYIITFDKMKSEDGGYSFFSVFNEEEIGVAQILIGIIASIVISLLFSIGALTRENDTYSFSWEHVVSIFIILSLIVYFIYIRYIKNK